MMLLLLMILKNGGELELFVSVLSEPFLLLLVYNTAEINIIQILLGTKQWWIKKDSKTGFIEQKELKYDHFSLLVLVIVSSHSLKNVQLKYYILHKFWNESHLFYDHSWIDQEWKRTHTWYHMQTPVTGMKIANTCHATWDITAIVPRICIIEKAHHPILFAISKSSTLWSVEAWNKNFQVLDAG